MNSARIARFSCKQNPKPFQRAFFSSKPSSRPQPRHLQSIADLTPDELTTLVLNASKYKKWTKSGKCIAEKVGALSGRTVAMVFNKRSTRTRISTEGAVVQLGGHPMFLGKDDIQLGVNESLRDTATVLSSMTAAIVARVGPHSDIEALARNSTTPVINALSDDFHPLQAIADMLTLHEELGSSTAGGASDLLGLAGRRIAWIGDANNVFADLAIAAAKLGVGVSIATPAAHRLTPPVRELISRAAVAPHQLREFDDPPAAVSGADVIVTDTWISMGQEAEKTARLKTFEGFRIDKELIRRGKPRDGWKFMHCLPRHQEEVSDEIFYGPNSVVFQEAENRLWAALAVLDAFVAKKGRIEAV